MEGAHQATANQISITKSERGNTEVVRDDVGGYSKIQPGEFPAGPVNCRLGSVIGAGRPQGRSTDTFAIKRHRFLK
jgi:hypothetical protein